MTQRMEFIAVIRKNLVSGEILGVTLSCRTCLEELEEAPNDIVANERAGEHLAKKHDFKADTDDRVVRNYREDKKN